MARASIDDLEEIAEGKASARDKAEAGVENAAEARKHLTALRRRGAKTRTTHRKRKLHGANN